MKSTPHAARPTSARGSALNSVSVVIPTYNRSAVLPAAIHSVIAQEDCRCEIVVVDDGSTDNTRDALAPLMERIRYVRTENRGVSAARNRGIAEASGEWIAFQDSDDTWHPRKIALQLECLQHTGAKVCICPCIDDSGESLDDVRKTDPTLGEGEYRYYPPGDCRLITHTIIPPFMQSMLIHRSVLARLGGFDQSLPVAEDQEMMFRLMLRTGYAVVNSDLVTVSRKRSFAGLTDFADLTDAVSTYECCARVQSELYWQVVPIDRAAARKVRERVLYYASKLAQVACAAGDHEKARRYARAAMDPRDTWKGLLRNLLIGAASPLLQGHYAKRWRAKITGTQAIPARD